MKIIKSVVMASTIDYPNVIATVLFVGNCNWNCDFCYNSNLPSNDDLDFNNDILPKMLKRKNFVDHVVISGGEISCYYDEAIKLIDKLNSYGFTVGIHSNGSNPNFIKDAIKHNVKFIGMDIKADTYINYKKIIQTDINFDKYEEILQSIQIIMDSGIEYEFRTTVYPLYLNIDNCINIAKKLSELGCNNYIIQQYDNTKEEYKNREPITPYSKKYLEDIVVECNKYIYTSLRGY